MERGVPPVPPPPGPVPAPGVPSGTSSKGMDRGRTATRAVLWAPSVYDVPRPFSLEIFCFNGGKVSVGSSSLIGN